MSINLLYLLIGFYSRVAIKGCKQSSTGMAQNNVQTFENVKVSVISYSLLSVYYFRFVIIAIIRRV